MKVTISEGESLLVDGPASIKVISGGISIFGAQYAEGATITVPGERRLPVTSKGTSILEIPKESAATTLQSNPIPPSWMKAVSSISSSSAEAVLVIGESDSGKSSFCTLLANACVREGKKVGVVDTDIGQSDIGPPGTVGLAVQTTQATSLISLRADALMFVGAKTPSAAFQETLQALSKLNQRASEMDMLIVNTDGWTRGEGAAQLKHRMMEIFRPEVIVAVRKGDELDELISSLDVEYVMMVDSPPLVRERDPTVRRRLRELAFRRYLRGAAIRSFPLAKLYGSGNPQKWGKLLVGLEDRDGEMLGIGVIESVDVRRRTAKVYTPVTAVRGSCWADKLTSSAREIS